MLKVKERAKRKQKSLALLAVAGSFGGVLAGLAASPAGALERPLESSEGSQSHGAVLGQGARLEAEKEGSQGARSVQSLSKALYGETIGTQGQDVSGYQPTVDFKNEYQKGSRFVYVKASEGSYYKNPYFSKQYSGADSAGLLRGAYHFAIPDYSSGAAQARYFVSQGGGWTADGKTLPGLLDMEWNPYGQTCYDMTQAEMRTWIQDFVNTYKSLTGRPPAIYTASSWWNTCVGKTTQFSNLPLHIANYNSTVGSMPTGSGWSTYDIWQYSDSGRFAGDSNTFNGSLSELRDFAKNPAYLNRSAPKPVSTPSPAPVTPAPVAPAPVTEYRLTGAIGEHYRNFGGEQKFGKPVNNEHHSPSGDSMRQDFDKGYSIIWSERTGAHSVYNRGDIGWTYSQKSSELGLPITSETVFTATGQQLVGAKQVFKNLSNSYESVAYWSEKTGTKFSNNRGAINAKYLSNTGAHGYPSTDETAFSYGAKQDFSRGSVIYWSEETGARSLNGKGAINAKWLAGGGPSTYGFPKIDEVATTEKGAVSYFKKGSSETAIYWSEPTGAKVMNAKGAIYQAWKQGGSIGKFGFPVSDESFNKTTGKIEVNYSKGWKITWTEREGTRVLKTS